ncbi:MAG: glycosyl hydrolase 108 family protein [Nitrospirota bacterium]
MSRQFDKSFSVVVGEEGYESRLRGDPGGLTIFGISGRYYPDLVRRMMAMSREDALKAAKNQYEHDYWNPAGCDELFWPMCLLVFDTAVNMGEETAKHMLAQSGGDWNSFMGIRRLRYETIAKSRPEQARFLPGWLNRLSNLEKVAREPLTQEGV